MTAMTTSESVAVDWPPAATPTMVSWALARVPGRVLRTIDDYLSLALVLPGRPVSLPQPGGDLIIQWTDGLGLHERPGILDAFKRDLLHVAATGPVSSTQRRQFFRAPVAISLTISDGSTEATGITLDLSEGGTRAAVDTSRLLPRAIVTAMIHVEGDSVEVPSTVVRHVPRGRRTEVGLEFGDLPQAAADLIRRHVFMAQVAARRAGATA